MTETVERGTQEPSSPAAHRMTVQCRTKQTVCHTNGCQICRPTGRIFNGDSRLRVSVSSSHSPPLHSSSVILCLQLYAMPFPFSSLHFLKTPVSRRRWIGSVVGLFHCLSIFQQEGPAFPGHGLDFPFLLAHMLSPRIVFPSRLS